MFDDELIREEISNSLEPVRGELAENVLLRIHPNRVQELAIADKSGDILLLFPRERVTNRDERIQGYEEERSLTLLVLVNLPNYYSEIGAAKVARKIEARLRSLLVTGAIYPIRFNRRQEYSREKRWILEVYFDIIGRFVVIESRPTEAAIAQVDIAIAAYQ